MSCPAEPRLPASDLWGGGRAGGRALGPGFGLPRAAAGREEKQTGSGSTQQRAWPCLAAPVRLLPNQQRSAFPFHVLSLLVITPVVTQEWAQIRSPWKGRAIEHHSAIEHCGVSSEGALGMCFNPTVSQLCHRSWSRVSAV